MIYSNLANYEYEKATFPAPVRRAIDRLLDMDLDALPAGRHEFGEPGMYLLINEVTTQPKEHVKPESHLVHTDLQLLLTGRERMVVAKLSASLEPEDDRFAAQDIAFYGAVSGEIDVDLVPGAFVVLYPTDIHRPNCSVEEDIPIRKAVAKIHQDLFADRG
ncbi:YhcH/YjgK/YiaL family protein [Paenibacillus spongiae]|uniref:YhcH/YjgK/YiaL family protein n=1 Tax=Paenibacillus spongiae TaxID=2909671 RepID=A0ABY5SBE2_9BACL|nr:YhcH/YjgK/YiaL family protein [Paenibacillus spongiae]UVI30018.1 YhcH/YjgK/YiaL family protein [Paenibacillus spongiae]